LVDNSGYANREVLEGIVMHVEGLVKSGVIYKGKSGENYRIYTCRLLECFSVYGVELN